MILYKSTLISRVLTYPSKEMALFQNIFILVILVSMTRGNLTKKDWTTVYRFFPLNYNSDTIVFEPKVPISNSTGYSLCLKICIWKWDVTTIFESPAVQLTLFADSPDGAYRLCLYITKTNEGLCVPLDNASSEWIILCITHNFTDSFFNVTKNGEPKGGFKFSPKSTFLNDLTKPIPIGNKSIFWGQITDFNIWNRPLSNEEIKQYAFGCKEGLPTQPEILDWSATHDYFEMQKQHLPCENGIEQSHFFFENNLQLNYTKAVAFCNLLRGDLIDPIKEELSRPYFHHFHYWLPIVNPNSSAVNHTINSTQAYGQKIDQCKYVNIFKTPTIEYQNTACKDTFPSSICKVIIYAVILSSFGRGFAHLSLNYPIIKLSSIVELR